MPEVLRQPVRMECMGIDLAHPVDRMPAGYFPYLFNARVTEEGRIEGRPGYTSLNPTLSPAALHSIRRLNDLAALYAADGYTYIIGNSTQLWQGAETAPLQIDTGYSGDPLSLITTRPENSPVSWMYVYDRLKQVKVRPDGVLRPIGVVPPGPPTTIAYGVPAMARINDGKLVSGWTESGAASAPTIADRTNGDTATIYYIKYDVGSTGWCVINPLIAEDFWTGPRMSVLINAGFGTEERVVVREIHPAFNTTTVAAIKYDSGSTGACTLMVTGSPAGVARNSILSFAGESVRVLSVSLAVDGVSYSVRCVTVGTIAAGDAVTGNISWYCYTVYNHVATQPITVSYVKTALTGTTATLTGAASLDYIRSGIVTTAGQTVNWVSGDTFVDWPPGTKITINGTVYTIDIYGVTSPTAMFIDSTAGVQVGVAYSVLGANASHAAGRPISVADDYMHLSLYLEKPDKLVEIRITIDVSTSTSGIADAFKRNYYTWTITPDQVTAGASTWTELTLPISAAEHTGAADVTTFQRIAALKVEMVTVAASFFGFDDWYFFGTYGPTIIQNSPVGYLYETRDRDASTGAASVPGPAARFEMFPLREQVIITPEATSAQGVTSLDIYRRGGALTDFTYIGTAINNSGSPNSFSDEQPDSVVAGNPAADLTLIQPWPLLVNAWAGVANVVGTTVTWVSGTAFSTALLSATVILINGIAYQTYGQPHSATFLEIVNSGGSQSNVVFQVESPTLAGQPLGFVFGPLEGPFLPVNFALGDPINAGTLYYNNPANPDAAADTNSLEVCPPSEPLMSGAVWNGFVFVGSNDNLFLIRYSYLTTLDPNSSGPLTYQSVRLPAPSGIWHRRTCCAGPDGVYYVGRDSIYCATDAGAVDVALQLYPLFPHDGQAAVLEHDIYPVDMTQAMRLTPADNDIYFDYVDTAGNSVCMRYECLKKRWFPHFYEARIATHYLVEREVTTPTTPQLLLLTRDTGLICKAGGNTDNGTDINTIFQTPSYDGGDERVQKLYVDVLTDADGIGNLTLALGYNNNSVYSGVVSMAVAARSQYLKNVASLADLSLYRNVSAKYAWTGGPAGPRVYAFEPSGYVQPYLSTFLVTQYINLSFPGWKHHRRLYAGMITNGPVAFTIRSQDGRTYGPYTIPNSFGQFRIWPLMINHGCKDLAFAYELDGMGATFALFPEAFTLETKDWVQPDFIQLAVFKT